MDRFIYFIFINTHKGTFQTNAAQPQASQRYAR